MELITAAYKQDHSALLACATLSRSLKQGNQALNYAMLYRNQSGKFSLAESVQLEEPGTGGNLAPSFWRSLADMLVVQPQPGSKGLEKVITEHLSSLGIGAEFQETFIHDVPPGGSAILVLVEDQGVLEKAVSILRSFEGRIRRVRLAESTASEAERWIP